MEAVVLSHSGELSLELEIGGFVSSPGELSLGFESGGFVSSSGELSLELDIFCFGVVHVRGVCCFEMRW